MGYSVIKIEYDGELVTRGRLVPRVNKWPWQSQYRGTNEVVSDFCVWVTLESDTGNVTRLCIQIKEGFTTDFASTPWITRLIFPQSMPGRNVAFVVHDKIYLDPHGVTINKLKVTLGRKTCDEIMRAVLLDKKAEPWLAAAMYAGVRAGGKSVWQKYRELQHRNNNAPP